MASEKAGVQVSIRIRPLNGREANTPSIIQVKNNQLNIRDPEKSNIKTTFNYDHIFNIDATQEDIFDVIGESLIDNAYKGYNCCVFAYGQTGCFAVQTPILMYNQEIKFVEDIRVGDVIMGDDQTPRIVQKLFNGYQPMYKIKSLGYGLPDYIVNQDHIMILNEFNELRETPLVRLQLGEIYIGAYLDADGKIKPYPFEVILHSMNDEYFGFMLDGNHRFQHASGIILRNSGKSHTMTGQPIQQGQKDQRGLIPRVCQELYNRQTDPNITYKIELSYMEIYSEQVRDLLVKQQKDLRVRQHPELGPYVEGLTQLLVRDYESIEKLIEQGSKERIVAATKMNAQSSRSHAILVLHFTQISNEYGKTKELISKINLVDLAGSERVDSSGVTGINFKEAIDINKSLSTLGIVINKLAAAANKNSPSIKTSRLGAQKDFIPFRDSVLTWILKESLGGNSKTVMVANVSPSSLNYNETLNTLRYAANAKQIVNNVKINEDTNNKIIIMLKKEIERLRSQIALGGVLSEQIKQTEELQHLEELHRQREKTWAQKEEESQEAISAIKQEYANKLGQVEQEYATKQTEFEQTRIVGAATKLGEYYETRLESKLQEIQKAADARIQEIQQAAEYKIQEIQKSAESKCEMLNIQIRQFRTERDILRKQLQQLQAHIKSQNQQGQLNPGQSNYNNQLNQTSQSNSTSQQGQLNTGQLNQSQTINELQDQINGKKNELLEIEKTYTIIHEKIHHLESQLNTAIRNTKEKLKNPTIEDLLNIKSEFYSIFSDLT